ncbi:hypothetical protein DQ04_09061000 [Trypanosoma grayi]|uniref:hypothetical protein n=1 Tax=Trypanosoma grayi TaxID=71804 RepID=UPI0004F42008|nr:hypothetical protein DQ04_09061000 [Trypanosoma grayi]KEG07693.1 hypothetical protein DQ04_09061000 [Trypanosoma grayi]
MGEWAAPFPAWGAPRLSGKIVEDKAFSLQESIGRTFLLSKALPHYTWPRLSGAGGCLGRGGSAGAGPPAPTVRISSVWRCPARIRLCPFGAFQAHGSCGAGGRTSGIKSSGVRFLRGVAPYPLAFPIFGHPFSPIESPAAWQGWESGGGPFQARHVLFFPQPLWR